MRERKSGFTLIEMLVVIAIISILAAMMSPSLQKALGSARQVACTNNLKQVGTALSLYAGDFSYYPAAWPKGESEDFNKHWWQCRLLPYSGQSLAIASWEQAAQARNTGIFACAEVNTPAGNANDNHFSMNSFTALASGKFDGYKLSHAVSGDGGSSAPNIDSTTYYVRPESRGSKPSGNNGPEPASAKIVFVSELSYVAGSQDQPGVRMPLIQTGDYMDQENPGDGVDGFKAAFRHNGKKNVLWFDLHAQSVVKGEVSWHLVRKD